MTPEEIILQFGYIGLFLISALAASIVPFSSEVFVLIMPPLGFNIWLVGIVATAGNVAGAYTVYWIGLKGIDYVLERYPRMNRERLKQAEAWMNRWGGWPLLLISLPIIGDPLALVAGSLKMNAWRFGLWATIGKGWRYILLLGALEWFLTRFGL